METEQTPQTERMDPLTRRKILNSLSQPTNPVPGAIIHQLESNVSAVAIARWQQLGWIRPIGTHYELTDKGSRALRMESPPPPDSYYPYIYNLPAADE